MSAKEGLSYLFCNLMMHDWWGRVWVKQEVAVSSRATIVIGESELEWPSFFTAIMTILASSRDPRRGASPMASKESGSLNSLGNIQALLNRVNQGNLPSISRLFACNRQEATDPRDLVYAFLGLAKERDDPLLTPNYSDSNSVSAVFINLIEYSI